MRVLAIGSVYPPHHLGGYEVIWSGVMRHLREQGHSVRVLATDYRNPNLPAGAAEEPEVYRELDWYWREHEWRSLSLRERFALERHNAEVLDRHLDEFTPDAITWWPVGGMSLGLIERARRAGVPAVLFVLDPWLRYGPRHDLWIRTWARARPLARIAERLTGLPTRIDYTAAGRWVFCSATMRDAALATGLTPAHETTLLPGVDRAYLAVGREPEPPAWRWRLLYWGRVVEQKGVMTAIESLVLLPEATLSIVGDGDGAYRTELERAAARLGVAERVSFESSRPRDELPAAHRAADVVLFPVLWQEPWGLVPLEAMAVGRPVVATGRGGSGDYLADGQNSLLFNAGDAAGLASCVRTLAADPTLRERLRAGGYETAARHGDDVFNRAATAEIEAAARSAPYSGPPR